VNHWIASLRFRPTRSLSSGAQSKEKGEAAW
jgi:hypothetical protein